jgi:hypothetical protein
MARPGLLNHPKFRRLKHLLDEPIPHVLGYLSCMWEVGYECGQAFLGDELDVELAAQYPGPKGKLFCALLKCRFIDKVDGGYEIHDLFDHAPDYVQRRMRRELERQQKGLDISELRRQAARSRWFKQGDVIDHQPDPTDNPADANGCKRQTLASWQDANGATPAPAPAPAPAPNGGMNSPMPPSRSAAASVPEREDTQEAKPDGSVSCSGVGEKRKRARKRRRCAESQTEGFAEFWFAYPRKVAKQDAVRAWNKLGPDPDLRAAISNALEAQKHSDDWKRDGGQFIPYAATWLNGRRWEDETESPSAPMQSEEEYLEQQEAFRRQHGLSDRASEGGVA